MSIIDVEQLVEDLKKDEGYSRTPYFDTEGYITIGYGHCIDKNPLSPGQREVGKKLGFYSLKFHDWLLREDAIDTIDAIRAWRPALSNQPEHFQRAIANMVYQMGIKGLSKFKQAWAAYDAGDLVTFRAELKDSEWYRKHTARALRVISLLTKKQPTS